MTGAAPIVRHKPAERRPLCTCRGCIQTHSMTLDCFCEPDATRDGLGRVIQLQHHDRCITPENRSSP